MTHLNLSEEAAQQMGELEVQALGVLKGTLDGEVMDDAAKAAMKIMGVVAKNRQTLTNRQALHFNMASAVGTTEQLEAYVATTQPTINKALMGGTDA